MRQQAKNCVGMLYHEDAWTKDYAVFVAEEESRILGFAELLTRLYRYFLEYGELYVIEILLGDQWLPIGDVALCPDTVPILIGSEEYRSKGYGKRALTLVVQRARHLGWKKLITCGIYTYNPRSRGLFESVGFKLVDTRLDEEGQLCWFHEMEL